MSNAQVAQTILNQLGGNKFLMMTGANSLSHSDKSLAFKLPRAANTIKYVRITLSSMDTYDVVYMNRAFKEIQVSECIYCDQLQNDFTSFTKLYTSL